MLKNKLIAGAIFALAMFVGITASAAYTFPSKIVTKQQKMDVQTVLNMMTPTPGLQVDGSFGPKTIAAVKAFQTSKGLVADGKIGPMTRAALEAFAAGTTVSTGTTGTTTTVALCPNGMTLASNCSVAPTTTGTTTGTTTVATGSTDGSITASTSSYVSSGISIKKGETKDVAAVRLQAVVGPVKVTRVDVQFNVRPWLFFSQVTLHDNTGKVLATKALSSIADTTEITVGSLYQVRFDGLNYTVTPGTNPDLAVGASVLAATDKIPSEGQPVTTGITNLRTLSEIGYADTVTYGGINNVTLTSTGSVADLYTRISPSSPVAGQQVVSLTQTTSDVTLGAFSIKSANNSSTLNTLSVAVNAADTTDFSNYRLYVAGQSVAGGVLSAGTVTFSNMTVPLALDTWTDLTIKADIKALPTSTQVYLGLVSDASHVVVTDANYGTPTFGTSGTRSTNILTLTSNSVAISNATATLGSAIVQGNSTVGYNATYAFTLTNNSNNDLYVNSTPAAFVATTKTSGTATLTSVTVSPSTVNGDDTYSYAIPAGTARTFSFPASIYGSTGSAVTFKATGINYSTAVYTTIGGATTGTPGSISTGLSALSLTASF